MKYNSTEQQVIWFRDKYNSNELQIKPPYQRQPVWSARQKCALIESILLGLPIPELYVQHTLDVGPSGGEERSIYAVVDGQQRIRTALQFIGIDETGSEQEYNGFSLDKLENRDSPFRGLRYADLSVDQRNSFLTYRFAVRQIDTGDDEQVRDLFKRINKFVTKLNDQELRNATYTGPFVQAVNHLSDDPFWAQSGLVTPSQIRRMKDIQFVSELLIGVIHGPQGGGAKVIDSYYTMYEDYDEQFPSQKTATQRFELTRSVVKDLLSTSGLDRFRSNVTDFYSLFVCVAALLIQNKLLVERLSKVRAALRSFGDAVDIRLSDEAAKVTDEVIRYVRAVEKGANEKGRRAERHEVLTALLQPYFQISKGAGARQMRS